MKKRASSGPEPIAIVGMGCRFPGGANDPASFWKMLCAGVDAITEIPADRWNLRAHHDPEPGRPGRTRARHGGFVAGIDQFDPEFFGISPREAPFMDPQHRLLLETAWEALEDGGQTPDLEHGSRTGVFVGLSTNDYSLLQNGANEADIIGPHTATGTAPSIAANRISHCFNFHGPSLAVDTACSSSLVALHLACRSLRAGECDSALVAGVNCLITPSAFIAFSSMAMLSPDGRCQAFDAAANGFVRGEGAGAVVLKPLSAARAARDPIYAVIRGTAVNQDGRTPGMTMPDQRAQAALVRAACRAGRVRPAEVQYVEAHGTGTLLGDPVEAAALSAALCRDRSPREPCLLGSVKTNIGHLEAGAGIAGLIKLALVLHHRAIPPSLHFQNPNPKIDFDRLKLRVPTTLTPFPRASGPLLAAVNSFGFGGTNAHAVLESSPRAVAAQAEPAPRVFLLPISARGAGALETLVGDWQHFLRQSPAPTRDLVYSASLRRLHHPQRAFAVGRSAPELAESLDAPRDFSATSDRRVVFVFSGHGAQWAGMGCGLLEAEPVFREKLRECAALLRQLGGWSLLDELRASGARSRLEETAIAQPAIFSVQVALAALWKSWGIQPAAIIGHSVGEVAAAHEAGVLGLEDAMRVIFHRGRCMEHASAQGRMLAVGLSVDALRSLNGALDRVSLAAVNSPSSVTLAGDRRAIQRVARELAGRGIFHREVRVRYAFHSPQMEPVRDALLRALAGLRPQTARVPIVSTVTGALATGAEFDAEYWWRNVRETVHFKEAVQGLIASGHQTFLELDAHPILLTALHECLGAGGGLALPSLRRGADEQTALLTSLGRLYAAGQTVHWPAVLPEGGECIPLPRHPWQRAAYWRESASSRQQRLWAPDHPFLSHRLGTPEPAWETKIDRRLLPFLGDHRVHDHVVLPAAACVEMALAVSRAATPEEVPVLEEVEFQKFVFVPEDDPAVLHVSQADGGFSMRGRSGDAWITHASGRFGVAPAAPPQRVDRVALEQRCTRPVAVAAFYAHLAEIGLPFGPSFRGVQAIHCGDREALGHIRLPEPLTPEGYGIHPALLDACWQMIAAPLLGRRLDVAFGVFSPWKIGRLRFFASPGREVWVQVRLRKVGARIIEADLTAFDREGAVCFEVEKFTARLIESTGRGQAELLYAPQWRVAPLPPASAATAPGAWLVLADHEGVGRRMAALLRRRGDACAVIAARATGQPEDWLKRHGECRGVLDFRSLDARTDDLERARALTCDGVLRLVQALAQRTGDHVPQLWLITRHAQATGPSQRTVSAAGAPLWGLGRVIMAEQRALRCRLVDLSGAPGELAALGDELHAAADEPEIALRGTQRLVSRLARAPDEAAPASVVRLARRHPCRLEVTRPGVLEQITFQAVPRRAPGPGEVEIEIAAAGLNFRDVMKALGVYPAEETLVLGDECAGTIIAVGRGVTGLNVGDEVLALASGCFAPFVTTPAAAVVRKPAALSMAQAATVPVAFLTAWYALTHLGRMRRGERVLIHAAAGGVGLAAVQLARAAGAEIFATAGSAKKRAFLRDLGVTHVMDSRSLAFADEVMKSTGGRGVDLVLNSLSGAALEQSLALLAPGGRFLEIGKRDIYENTRIGLHPFRKNAAFHSIDLGAALHGPLLRAGWRQLQRGLADGALTPLPVTVHPLAKAQDALRALARARHIGKIALSMRTARVPISAPARLLFSGEASYLVTGGTGGIGLAVAQWLVANGARQLVLTNRSGEADASARAVIAELEARGARVLVEKCDAGSAASVKAILVRLAATRPPLRGVFHLAAAFDDGVLTQLDPERFRAVLAAKADGAWHLHRLTRRMPLDFFVLFSSVSSLFGNPGQGNYAAANAFLDTLAHQRRAQGLPALVVNWGPFAEVGYAARQSGLEAHLERLGWRSLQTGEALRALETLLLRGATHGVVARCDWSRLPEAPRCRELLAAAARDASAGDSRSTRAALLAAAPEARGALMDTFLRAQIAHVLRTSPAKLASDRSLNELGLDSLMAVELLNRLEEQLGIAVPTGQLMGGPTLTKLTAILLALLHPGDALTAPPAADVSPASPLDLRTEVRLDPAIRWNAPQRTGPLRAILLTEATGFLGAFLLRELLEGTTADIHCLSPAADVARAMDSIAEDLGKFCPGTPLPRHRIIPVLGSLAQPRLGLAPARFRQLAGTLDAIFHNAAQVSHVAAYAQLKAANVFGTHEVIRLAASVARKPLHYVSSVSVFAAAESSGAIAEADPLTRPDALAMGYAESRWVAEQTLLLARERGLPVSIYRPGYITGDSVTGILPVEDLLWRFVRACLGLGTGPMIDLPALLAPVDFVARAVLALAQRPGSGTWHLIHPQSPSLRELLGVAQRMGYPLKFIAKSAWETAVTGLDRAENPLLPYLLFYPARKQQELRETRPLLQIDGRQTLAALRDCGFAAPALDAAVLAQYFRHLIAAGALPPPPRAGLPAPRRAPGKR